MTDFEKLFSGGTPNFEKLLQTGFRVTERGYFRETPLSDFYLRVSVSREGKTSAELYDPEADAPYTLHLVAGAEGAFVGEVRKIYEQELLKIAETCFDNAVFQSRFANELICYARDTYGEEAEYLWEKFPKNGVLRRKDNRKWYAAILTVAGNKVGLSTDSLVEIVDLRAEEQVVNRLKEQKGFAPAWHMNKKSWLTVLLNGSVELSTIKEMIDNSRNLALKK